MTPEDFQRGDRITIHYDSDRSYTGMYMGYNTDREDKPYIRMMVDGKLFPMRLWTFKTVSIEWISRGMGAVVDEMSSI